MTYTEPLFNQISRFVTSIGFGFLLCILYIAVVFLRMCISEKRWAIIVQDLFFSFLTTVISFFFMVLYNNGEVRLNLVTGQLVGGLVLYFTVGKYVLTFLEKCAIAIRRLIALMLKPVTLYIRAFPSFFGNAISKIKDNREKVFKGQDQKGKVKTKNKCKKKKYSRNPLEKSE